MKRDRSLLDVHGMKREERFRNEVEMSDQCEACYLVKRKQKEIARPKFGVKMLVAMGWWDRGKHQRGQEQLKSVRQKSSSVLGDRLEGVVRFRCKVASVAEKD